MTITVVLVDDHEVIREGMRRALEREVDIDVIGEAATLGAADALLAHVLPTVFVVDIRLPDGNGLDFIRRARAHSSELGLVVLTMYPGDEPLLGALEAGRNGCRGPARGCCARNLFCRRSRPGRAAATGSPTHDPVTA